ncbi:MAG TPA: DNA gyrase/topoisomerase IV subunit A, partial [Flavobacteriales bacterium]|nr:DNA gyrase/topoisomerase IV subunit A [Flavobacteriales bacterium]
KLNALVDYAIDYFKELKRKYGAGRERKTELRAFDTIVATAVAVANKKLYLARGEGFIGWSLRSFEQVDECSEIDDIIVFRADGTMLVTKVADKKFVGKGVLHAAVWKKGDERTIYHLIYQDGSQGPSYMKRFAVTGITRDKEYDLTNGSKGSKVLYFTANPDGASEVVRINLRPRPNLRKTQFDVDFGALAVKGRGSKGNLLTRHIVHKVVQKERGGSTLGAIPVWFDDTVRRLNEAGHGRYLGRFSGEDKILAILSTGHYQLFPFALGTHFPDEALTIVKWDPETPITAVYWEGEKQQYNVKRFLAEAARDPVLFITDHPESKLALHTLVPGTMLHVAFDKRSNDRPDEEVNLTEFIAVKGIKAIGNRLTPFKVKDLKLTGDVFTVMTPELEEQQHMLITEEEIGHLPPPEAEGLERSPMEEFRKSHKVEKPAKEDRSPDDPIIGYKPGKQMDLGLE